MYIFLTISIRSSFTHLHGFRLVVLLPQFIEITALVLLNRINLLNLRLSSDRVIIVKGFLKLPNLHMLLKKESITSQKLGSWGFLQIANNVLNKGKSAIHSLFNNSASDKAKLFAENFSKNSILDDSGIFTCFPF